MQLKKTVILFTQIDVTGFAHFAVEAFHYNHPPPYICIRYKTNLHQWRLRLKMEMHQIQTYGEALSPSTCWYPGRATTALLVFSVFRDSGTDRSSF